MCHDVSKLPVYQTGHCPKNQKELNERSSAINCTHASRYMCLPNEQLTELFEFCFTLSKMGINEGKAISV